MTKSFFFIKLYPDAKQRAVLDKAFQAYRLTRAACVRWIRSHRVLAERLVKESAAINPLKFLLRARYMTATVGSQRNPFFAKHRLWMLDVANEIRESAVSDAVSALKTCLTNVERGHQETFDIKIKQTREHGSFGVEKKIVWKANVLTFKFEKMFRAGGAKFGVRCPVDKIPFEHGVGGTMTPGCDCKVHKSTDGEFYLLATYSYVKQPENFDTRPVMAGDLGVRKFCVSYGLDGTSACIGQQTRERLLPMILKRDKIVRLLAKGKVTGLKKKKLKASLVRLKNKLLHLRDELHFKTISWITSKYSVAVIPHLRIKQLTAKTGNLHRSTKKVLAVLGHGRFYERLRSKCETTSTVLVDGDESYTSKGCDRCGRLVNVGSSERFQCEACGHDTDRDVHAARGILLKNAKIYTF